MTDADKKTMAAVAKEWLKARDVIAQLFLEMGYVREAAEHNAAALLARLAHADLVVTDGRREGELEEVIRWALEHVGEPVRCDRLWSCKYCCMGLSESQEHESNCLYAKARRLVEGEKE